MIRPEQAVDEAAIRDLVDRAFKPMWFSDGSEPELVDALRAAGDLTLSLVALDGADAIVGHIGFSPATIDRAHDGWFQMAPVSVSPEHQGAGIGSALIRAGIAAMRERGASGLAVVGNPAFYERFGFTVLPGLTPAAEPDKPYFRAQVLRGEAPVGTLRYAAAFG